ncbi:MAG: alpha/beta fold hydrolase [Saprospiraceae bacterium]|nr:alpha/beta fold hydrolase [Lewinella sp.]
MNIKEITYFSLDGFANAVRVFTNPNRSDAEVILCMPAMGTEAAYYAPFAEELVKAGYHVVTADWRGKGLSILRASRNIDFGYREIWHYDFPALFDCVREIFPDNNILVYGHSLGGQLSSLYLAAHPERRVKGLILHFSCHCHYKNWEKQRNKFYMWFKLFPWVARVWGYFPGEKVGFARREARTFMRDWGYSGIEGRYHAQGLVIDYDALGYYMELPILAFSLEGDELAPKSGVEHLYGLFPNAPVNHIHLPESAGERKRYSHFNWVHQPGFFIRELNKWRGVKPIESQKRAVMEEPVLVEI